MDSPLTFPWLSCYLFVESRMMSKRIQWGSKYITYNKVEKFETKK